MSEEVKICDSCLAAVVAKLKAAGDEYADFLQAPVNRTMTLLELHRRVGCLDWNGWLYKIAVVLENDGDLLSNLKYTKEKEEERDKTERT